MAVKRDPSMERDDEETGCQVTGGRLRCSRGEPRRDGVSDGVLAPISHLLWTESQSSLLEAPPPRLRPVGARRRCGRVPGWTLLPELGGGLRGDFGLNSAFHRFCGWPLDPFSVVGTRIWATLLILVTCCASEHLLASLLGSENAGFVHLNYNLAVIIRLY